MLPPRSRYRCVRPETARACGARALRRPQSRPEFSYAITGCKGQRDGRARSALFARTDGKGCGAAVHLFQARADIAQADPTLDVFGHTSSVVADVDHH